MNDEPKIKWEDIRFRHHILLALADIGKFEGNFSKEPKKEIFDGVTYTDIYHGPQVGKVTMAELENWLGRKLSKPIQESVIQPPSPITIKKMIDKLNRWGYEVIKK